MTDPEPITTYVPAEAVQAAVGGKLHLTEYQRAVEASTEQIDRWTGRRFIRDTVASERLILADDPDWVCVGDYTTRDEMAVQTWDATAGDWSDPWDPSEWQPGADDRGNGRFSRLGGEPWRWIGATGARKFPTGGLVPTVRAVTKWNWDGPPAPVAQACMDISVVHFQFPELDELRGAVDPIKMAKAAMKDYAVTGGTLDDSPSDP